ncbi:MAG: hypothetical protein D6B25_13485 [Desulfobulbaceae bacterium]|nr:MAG: hypothetical protein D6B25_13485 [Desulfobulbaceae bacterium]
MNMKDSKIWSGVDRRSGDRCRRSGTDRRVSGERRVDRRGATSSKKRGLKAWVRTLTNPRLGVDRRKGVDQRAGDSRRDIKINSLLTQEELSDLLK